VGVSIIAAPIQGSRRLFFNGNDRMRWPVPTKIAFNTAGVATKIVGSPAPPQKPPDGMMSSLILSMPWRVKLEERYWADHRTRWRRSSKRF